MMIPKNRLISGMRKAYAVLRASAMGCKSVIGIRPRFLLAIMATHALSPISVLGPISVYRSVNTSSIKPGSFAAVSSP